MLFPGSGEPVSALFPVLSSRSGKPPLPEPISLLHLWGPAGDKQGHWKVMVWRENGGVRHEGRIFRAGVRNVWVSSGVCLGAWFRGEGIFPIG